MTSMTMVFIYLFMLAALLGLCLSAINVRVNKENHSLKVECEYQTEMAEHYKDSYQSMADLFEEYLVKVMGRDEFEKIKADYLKANNLEWPEYLSEKVEK